jgi:glycogen phosphorylase
VSTKTLTEIVKSTEISKLLDQYGSGPIRFSGTDDNLYERHLLFDNVIDQTSADSRDRFEAFAHSVRDVLSQR